MRAGWVVLLLCAMGFWAIGLFCAAIAWATSRMADLDAPAPNRPMWLPPKGDA